MASSALLGTAVAVYIELNKRKVVVLRITRMTANGSSFTLKLQGKITVAWVTLLERECRSLIGKKKRVRLDFSDVSYMDFSGVEMMRTLPIGEVTIVNAPDSSQICCIGRAWHERDWCFTKQVRYA